MGLLRVVENRAIKNMSLKIKKHEKIAMLAVSALNIITSLISKALSDVSISDEKYSLILLEFKTFTRMKEDLRIKASTSLEKTGNIETEANVKKGVAGGSFLDTMVNNVPFEMHLPGHNFTGPGAKLYKRLNWGTPREWSMPINRVDNAAYHHDLCYSKHDDTKLRNDVVIRQCLVS